MITLIFKDLKKEYDNEKFGGEGKGVVDVNDVKTEFSFTTKQLQEHFDLSRQGLYDLLDVATDGVMGKVAKVKHIDKKSFEKLSLCSYAKFENGVLTLRVDKETARHMLDYSKGFAEVDFKLSLAMTGEYEKRILDLISRFKKKGNYFKCSLGEFYRMMEVKPSDYSSFTVFRRTVIERPLERLIEKADGVWTATDTKGLGYEIKKDGRSYKDFDTITFKMKYVEPIAKEQPTTQTLKCLADYIKLYINNQTAKFSQTDLDLFSEKLVSSEAADLSRKQLMEYMQLAFTAGSKLTSESIKLNSDTDTGIDPWSDKPTSGDFDTE